MPSPFRSIVFDLDGTLVDSRRDLAESANQLIRECGGKPLPEEVVGGMVGEGVRVWVPRALGVAGVRPIPADALDRFIALYEARLLNHTRAYEGFPDTLAQLATVAELAVLTNKLRRATVKILEGLGLARFFTQIGGIDGSYPPKPAPQGLQLLMARAGATPAETLLVGDSPIDLQTARNAQARICIARYGFGYVEASPETLPGDELFINQPAELLSILDLTAISPPPVI